jgi:hypothetical protein
MEFAVMDLFVVGLGFDLVGAWLLARGLIAKPEIIVMRNASYWASNAPSALASAQDRIDGLFGVGSLLLGFMLQALGYVLDLAGVGTTTADSSARTLTALGLLTVAVVLALGAWRLSHNGLLRVLLTEMAYWQPTRADEAPTRQDRANPTNLAYWAHNLGDPRRPGEDDWAYAKRVFDLTDDDLIEPGTSP